MMSLLRKIFPEDSLIRQWYSSVKAMIAAFVYGFPGEKLCVIGITGTDGKTTTTEMIYAILNNLGVKTAKISSVHFAIGDKTWENKTKRTTVSPFVMQKFLKQCLDEQVQVVVIEVSSHALAQNRVFGISFNIAVLTNITHEHLDYHKNMERLIATKKLLFSKYLDNNGIAILPVDQDIFEFQSEAKRFKTYSFNHPTACVYGSKLQLNKNNIKFIINNVEFSTKVLGEFNALNALAAIAVCATLRDCPESADLKFELKDIASALKQFTGVPGRLENLHLGHDYDIFIDFALTPNALEKVLQFLKSKTNGRLIIVFGCTGDHDKTKRPKMGAIAKKYADTIVLTDDETYTENAQEIREDIKKGIFTGEDKRVDLQDRSFYEVPNRRDAINTALQIASAGDCVLVSGMGTLESRNMNGKEIPWNDKKVIKEAFEVLQNPSKQGLNNLKKNIEEQQSE